MNADATSEVMAQVSPGSLLPVSGTLPSVGFGLWTLECVFRGNVGIHRVPKAIQVDGIRPRRVSLLGFPFSSLSGTFASLKLRGLCRRSYFGPRTCDGSITIVIEVGRALNPGFPFSPSNVHFCVQSVQSQALITVHSWWR